MPALGHQTRAPRSACRGRYALLHARKELGTGRGKEKGEAPTPQRTTRVHAADTPGQGATVSTPGPRCPLRTRKDLGAGRGKRGKQPQPLCLQGCTPWGAPGTGTTVSTPRPLRPTARQIRPWGLVWGGEGGAPTTPRTTRVHAANPPGTGTAVSTPKPLRPLRTRKDLGAGRGKRGKPPHPKDDKDARLGHPRHGRHG